MPGTLEEYVRFAVGEFAPGPWFWADGTEVTEEEFYDIVTLRTYHFGRRKRNRKPQRTAMRLLRSFLSPVQRDRLRSLKEFLIETPTGNVYRLFPMTGSIAQVTRHGDRWFVFRRFCLHDDPDAKGERMPPADLTLAHLLMLLSDEPTFLATANATDARDQLWNGAYQRRLRQARLEATT